MDTEEPLPLPLDQLPEPTVIEGQVSIAHAAAGESQPTLAPVPTPLPATAEPANAPRKGIPICCWVAVVNSVCSLVLVAMLWSRPSTSAPPLMAVLPAPTPPASAIGTPQAASLVLKPYLEAAQAGDIGAMRMLGTMYYHGLDLPRDRAEGLQWYRKAAASGSKVAQEELKQLE